MNIYKLLGTALLGAFFVAIATTSFGVKNFNSAKSNTSAISIAQTNEKIGEILRVYDGNIRYDRVINALAVGIDEDELKIHAD